MENSDAVAIAIAFMEFANYWKRFSIEIDWNGGIFGIDGINYLGQPLKWNSCQLHKDGRPTGMNWLQFQFIYQFLKINF